MIEEFLLQAFNEDQEIRLANEFNKYEEISKKHIAILKPYLETYAWTLIQHSDYDIEFQEYCLSLMKKSSNRQDLIAYLTDRILINRNLPQIYGTQLYFDEVSKKYRPHEIELPLTVESRRMEVGLNSLSDYIQGMYEFNL